MSTACRDYSSEELGRTFSQLGLVTTGVEMLGVLRGAFKAAAISDVTVLIEGETGTGKQVLAQAIHRLDGKRRAFPFITAHCSSITEALAECQDIDFVMPSGRLKNIWRVPRTDVRRKL